MREKIRTRSAALLVVGLLHVGLFAAFVFPSRSDRGKVAPELVMTLVYFDEAHPASSAPVETTAAPAPTVKRGARRQNTDQPSSAIGVPTPLQDEQPAQPPVDWSNEARRASEATLARQEKDRTRRSFDFPKVAAVPPNERRDHVFGDTEHYEGGETIMWLNSRCYITNRPIADIAGDNGPGPSIAQPEVCKPR